MKLGQGRIALVAALAASIVLAILLSPLGFERRPSADLTTAGYLSIAAVGVGVLLDIAAIVLALRRARLAPSLAIAGSIVFLVPIVTDKVGAFFTLPAPPVISALEYVFFVVLLVTVVLAWTVLLAAGGEPLPRA